MYQRISMVFILKFCFKGTRLFLLSKLDDFENLLLLSVFRQLNIQEICLLYPVSFNVNVSPLGKCGATIGKLPSID